MKHDILILQVIPGLVLHKRNDLTVYSVGPFLFHRLLMQFSGMRAGGIFHCVNRQASLHCHLYAAFLPHVAFNDARRLRRRQLEG